MGPYEQPLPARKPLGQLAAHTLLVLACLACLGPFVGKAFHIDDPLFLWTARQIQSHPADFFGYRVNWYTTETPMSEVTMNPPLTSYYLAGVISLFGEHEVALHLAFLVWAIGAVIGTYRLARSFCGQPMLAALLTLAAPAFLVSSTSLMCDVMMLCLWVWSVVCWERGLDEGKQLPLYVAGVLAALALLTKYFALAVVPLLLVYTLARQRRPGKWLLPLLIPVGVALAYQYLTFRLYGRGLLSGAAVYANDHRARDYLGDLIVGLSFTGGCVGSVVFYAPALWGRRSLILGGTVSLALAWLRVRLRAEPLHIPVWADILQMAVFIAGGLCLASVAVDELRRRRDAHALLLVAWIAGTFLFAAFVNWTMNARSILPLVPPAAIMIVRRLELRLGDSMQQRRIALGVPLLLTGVLSVLVAAADYCMAETGRRAARRFAEEYAQGHGPIWFQGHWGFQHYMQQLGGRVIDFDTMPGYEVPSVLLLPRNSTYVMTLNPNQPYGVHSRFVEKMNKVSFPTFVCAATMHPAFDAGYYSCSLKQSLPYSFCQAPGEEYWVMLIRSAPSPDKRTRK